MKYHDLAIETQRQAPNNARTEGFAYLVRAGYVTRENSLTPLGKHAINHLHGLADQLGNSFFPTLGIPTMDSDSEIFFSIESGSLEVIHCSSCKYTERIELAQFSKTTPVQEVHLPIEKVSTPACNTIEALANFLGLPKDKTAKAMMYTRLADGKFIFVVVRGDMQLSEAKLKRQVGDVRVASADEIAKAGAAAGYASPLGLRNALIIIDDLIPQSPNLVAGANEAGYHLKNTNFGRDYKADIVADLVQSKAGDVCVRCGNPLLIHSTDILATRKGEMRLYHLYLETILLALAETCHDDKGLILPTPVAPFHTYLMHIPGKELDTRATAEELYASLQRAGISVLFDDRDERAGVKFNDADLIGCPLRITVGEKNLREGMVELKTRTASESSLVPTGNVIVKLTNGL
jgi:prolyl-tRNA synthetase